MKRFADGYVQRVLSLRTTSLETGATSLGAALAAGCGAAVGGLAIETPIDARAVAEIL